MSRRNNKIKSKPIDSTKNNIYSGGGNNRRVFKKVGNKGDYAIVKNTSSNINLNKTGSGTSSNPYVYIVDFPENFTNVLSEYKTRNNVLEQKLRNIKGIFSKQVKTLRNLVVAKNVLIETNPKLNLVLFSPINLPKVLS